MSELLAQIQNEGEEIEKALKRTIATSSKVDRILTKAIFHAAVASLTAGEL